MQPTAQLSDSIFEIRGKDGDCIKSQCRHKKMIFCTVAAFAIVCAILVVLVIVLSIQIQALGARISVLESLEKDQRQLQDWDDAKEKQNDLSVNIISRQKRDKVSNMVTSSQRNKRRTSNCKKECRKKNLEKEQKEKCIAECKPAGRGKRHQEMFGAHYVGKVESILVSREDKISKDGKYLQSSDGKFPYWKQANWMKNYEHKDKFEFSKEKDGIKIMKRGLYYIYAQMTFRNAFPDNTLTISVNSSSPMTSSTVLRCSHSNALDDKLSMEENKKIHTCFGAILHPLRTGDAVYVQHFWKNSEVMWVEDRSFLGFIRLGDVKF